MEKRRNLKLSLLGLMAGYQDEPHTEDLTRDIELIAHLTAIAEFEILKRSGLPFTLH